MARPRLYHTVEERKAANCAKSKRHYHKEKSSIQERRRNGQQCPKKEFAADKKGFISASAALQRTSPLTYWLERVERLEAKLAVFFGDLPRRQYVDNAVKRFFAVGNKDVFRDEIVKLGNLQKSAHRYEAEILQLAGIGQELKKITTLERELSSIIHWFEELICQAMVDMSEFTEMYHRSKYQFQIVD